MKGKTQQNKLMKILTSPLRALSKARDMYVNGMNQCADRSSGYGAMGYWGIPGGDPLTRSASTSSVRSRNSMSYVDDDLRELIRATSAKTYGDRIDLTFIDQEADKRRKFVENEKKLEENKKTATFAKSRSTSVVMTKIDEDKALDEDEEDEVKNKGAAKKKSGGLPPLFPRSKSYAVTSQRSRDAIAF